MERTHSTPELVLKDNTLEMSGICTPENPPEFFDLFKEQIDMILTSKSKYDLVFHLDYFNTASSKCLLDLFRKVKQSPNQPNITITWVHAADDEEMRESGVLYSELAGINFLFRQAN